MARSFQSRLCDEIEIAMRWPTRTVVVLGAHYHWVSEQETP